jgi:hypothetical protein
MSEICKEISGLGYFFEFLGHEFQIFIDDFRSV